MSLLSLSFSFAFAAGLHVAQATFNSLSKEMAPDSSASVF